MDRRSDVRVTWDRAARVTALSGDGRQMQARTLDVSGRGVRILAPEPLEPGDAVKIEIDDALLLAEVCYCLPNEAGFMVGVEIDQALNGVSDLARLNRTLLDGGRGREAPQERGILLGK